MGHSFCISKTRQYKILQGMKQRCYNPNNQHYKQYGFRGITICDEWLGKNGAMNFYEWSILHGYGDKLTIDRVENDKGYSPENCIWIPGHLNSSHEAGNRLAPKLMLIIRLVPTYENKYLKALIKKVPDERERLFLMEMFEEHRKKKKARMNKSSEQRGMVIS